MAKNDERENDFIFHSGWDSFCLAWEGRGGKVISFFCTSSRNGESELLTPPPVLNIITYQIRGFFKNGQFRVNVIPIKAKPEAANNTHSSIGWTGQALYLIERYSDKPGFGQPLNEQCGFIYPMIYANELVYVPLGVTLALADWKAASVLTNKDAPPIIMSVIRSFPEEKSKYHFSYERFGEWQAEAICPGYKVARNATKDLIPLSAKVYHKEGFLRWSFLCRRIGESTKGMDLEFRLRWFSPKRAERNPTNAYDVALAVEASGVLHLLYTNVPLTDFRPPIVKVPLLVRDYRARKEFAEAVGNFKRDYHVVQTLHTKDWNEYNDKKAFIEAGRVILALQMKAERERKYKHYYRWAFYAGVVVVFGIPVWIALRSARRKNEG